MLLTTPVVLFVPGVELLARVLVQISMYTDLSVAATESNPKWTFFRSIPNWAGAMIPMTVFAVAATRPTAVVVTREYPLFAICVASHGRLGLSAGSAPRRPGHVTVGG